MIHQATGTKTIGSYRNWLVKIGGVAAVITAALLLIGLIGLIVSILQPSIANGWLSLFQNNWLIKIFLLHAQFNGLHPDLHGLNVLDIVILILVSILCLSLSTVIRKAGSLWSRIALALSLIAIALFVATQIAGRSTVMLAVLINSLVLLGEKSFGKITNYTGILAGLLLFVGDLTVGVHVRAITTLFGVGYLLLIAWFLSIAQILFRLSGSNIVDQKFQPS